MNKELDYKDLFPDQRHLYPKGTKVTTIKTAVAYEWTHPDKKIPADILMNTDKYKKWIKEIKIKYDE